MTWTWTCAYTPTIWPSFFTALLLSALSVYAWRRRAVPSALFFLGGCLLAALWAAGSVMEYAAVDVAAKIFWFKFQTIWQLPATTAITCFVLEYTWPGRWLTRRNLAVLSIPPLTVAVLILTDNVHHLMWLGFASDGSSVTPLRASLGSIFLVYSYGLSLVNIIALACLVVRSPEHRWPVGIILTGQIGARTVYALDAANMIQTGAPLGVLATALLFLMYGVALFGFGMFDPIPLARRTVIAQMQDGVLVLDPQGRVASLNPAAKRILRGPANRALGRSIQDLLPIGADPDGNILPAERDQTEFSLGAGPETRHYVLASSPLKDWRGLTVGRLLLLSDVTAQKQAQAQHVRQQRALAMQQEREHLSRELHDSLGQVFAFIGVQGQTIQRLLSRGEISKADACLERLVEAARAADVDIRESMRGLRLSRYQEGLFAALEEYLVQFERDSGIQTKFERSEAISEGAFEPLVEIELLRILQEALTNVRKHAGAGCVQIVFAADDGFARVVVGDDGQGFSPAAPSDPCGKRIGLRVMRERAIEVGGSLRVNSAPGEGTEIVIRVPLRPEPNDLSPAKRG